MLVTLLLQTINRVVELEMSFRLYEYSLKLHFLLRSKLFCQQLSFGF